MPGLSLIQRTAGSAGLLTSRVLVLSENSCSDTNIFSACLASTRIESDPGPILLEMENSFREAEYEFVFGLSRDSNFVLIEQYAQASAYQLCYHGTHRYDANNLSHSFRGNRETANYLSEHIFKQGRQWAEVISQIPAISKHDDALMLSEVLVTKQSRPAKSPGHLVSWLFKRNLS